MVKSAWMLKIEGNIFKYKIINAPRLARISCTSPAVSLAPPGTLACPSPREQILQMDSETACEKYNYFVHDFWHIEVRCMMIDLEQVLVC